MNSHSSKNAPATVFLALAIFACVSSIVLFFFLSLTDTNNNIYSFSSESIKLSKGWTIQNSDGATRELELPYTLDYGKDGEYTLYTILPSGLGDHGSTNLEFYSNYIDFKISLDNELIYEYPFNEPLYSPGTGNSWHYITLYDYEDKELKIEIFCQLSSAITYLIEPPILGSNASMLHNIVLESLPALVISSCMAAISLALTVFYIVLKRKLSLDSSTLHMALFAFLFALYVFMECSYTKRMASNSYIVYSLTFMLLALLPIPLLGLFANDLNPNLKKYAFFAMILCYINYFAQTVLHFSGLSNFRIMMVGTHITIIISITLMVISLFISARAGSKKAGLQLISALPMLAGGFFDIVLIWINRPSFNNSFWFLLGVTVFIILQFASFVNMYFSLYHSAIESDVLRNLAFSDSLSGIKNRNAYDQRIKELDSLGILPNLGCIVADINKLKYINDTFGHQIGDVAIGETGRLLKALIPDRGECYRTGGDEFVVLIEGISAHELNKISDSISNAVKKCSERRSIPFSISLATGLLTTNDSSVSGFISRVDAAMYSNKHKSN